MCLVRRRLQGTADEHELAQRSGDHPRAAAALLTGEPGAMEVVLAHFHERYGSDAEATKDMLAVNRPSPSCIAMPW